VKHDLLILLRFVRENETSNGFVGYKLVKMHEMCIFLHRSFFSHLWTPAGRDI